MKQIIFIVIIVVALAGAGVFAYLSFFSDPATEEIKSLGTTSKSASSDILPLGSNLNFDTVKSYNKDERIFQYPAVNPTEVGPALNTIIKQ